MSNAEHHLFPEPALFDQAQQHRESVKYVDAELLHAEPTPGCFQRSR